MAVARRAAAPPRPTGAAEARLAEKDKLSAAYNRERRRRIDALCEGEHGAAVKDLIRFLRRMDLKSGRELVARIEGAAWARTMPPGDRQLLLSIVGGAIRLLRERNDLTPFDDPLWDQPPNVFEQCKALLEVR